MSVSAFYEGFWSVYRCNFPNMCFMICRFSNNCITGFIKKKKENQADYLKHDNVYIVFVYQNQYTDF